MARRTPVEIRVITPDDWRVFRELRLQALADAPEAFGARLADWQGIGDTETRWRARLEWADLNIIGYLDDEPLGMASGVIAGDIDELRENAEKAGYAWEPQAAPVELISMWVAPFARGNGMATAVITGVVAWASEHHRDTFLVVRADNERAKAAYARAGFVDLGPRARPNPGEPREHIMLRRARATDRA